MLKQADTIDSLWCMIFSLTSMGAGLWFCWHVSVPI